MAETNKTPELKGLSPKGHFKYPHLTDPDYGTEEYPKEDGELNVRLILDAESAEAFREQLSELYEEADRLGQEADKKRKPALRKQKPYTLNPLGTDVYDDDEEDPQPTGDVEFSFKTKYSGVSKKTGKKWTRTLPLFDAKGKPIKGKINIWGGTVGRIGFVARPYFVAAQGVAGVSFYLEAAKIIELSTGSGGNHNASEWGMDEDEGDFSADSVDPMTEDESGDGSFDAGDTDGSDDF